MDKSDSIKNIAKNLAVFRKQVKQPVKDAKNPFFKSTYVTLEGVTNAIDDALPNDLTYVQEVTAQDKAVSVSTILLDSSGEYIQFAPVTMTADKNTPQAIGSAETYARRYSLSAVFGITSDLDDDGNASSSPKQYANRKQTQRSTPKEPLADDAIRSELTSEIKTLSLMNRKDNKDNLERLMKNIKISSWKGMTQKQAEAMKATIKVETGLLMEQDDSLNLEETKL